jgi:hypothetical protein
MEEAENPFKRVSTLEAKKGSKSRQIKNKFYGTVTKIRMHRCSN